MRGSPASKPLPMPCASTPKFGASYSKFSVSTPSLSIHAPAGNSPRTALWLPCREQVRANHARHRPPGRASVAVVVSFLNRFEDLIALIAISGFQPVIAVRPSEITARRLE
jgi:hypothetical protein